MRPRRVLQALRRLVVGLAVASAMAGLGLVFVLETLPYQVPKNAAPRVALTAAEIEAASTFPAYADAIPVINYHDVSGRRGTYSVGPALFARQLAALRQAGFHTVQLQDVLDLVAGRRPRLPSRPLLITFDDGIASEYENADTVLRRYGFHAVTFVITGALADKTPSYYLTRSELEDLARSGTWQVGAHTDAGHGMVPAGGGASGPWLTTLVRHPDGSVEPIAQWRDRVDRDLSTAARKLAGLTGPVRAFAYPFSAVGVPTNDARLAGQVVPTVARHYDLAFTAYTAPTTAVVPDSPRWLLPRFEVTAGLEPGRLLDALAVMVPKPPSRSVVDWRLTDPQGRCRTAGNAVTVVTSGYTRCSTTQNGRGWTDYTLRVRLSGLDRTATGLVAVRDSGATRWEVALSDSRWEVRLLSPGWLWRTAAAGTLRRSAVPSRREVVLSAHGDRAVLTVDGHGVWAGGGLPGTGWGTVGLGVAATAPRTVVFDRIRLDEEQPAPAG